MMPTPTLSALHADAGYPGGRTLDAMHAWAASEILRVRRPTDIHARLARFALTPKQMDVARVFIETIERDGMAPTLEEVAEKLGNAKVVIYEHRKELERKGVLKVEKYRSRAVMLGEGVGTSVIVDVFPNTEGNGK